jgi:hypothetical protein
VIVSEGTGHMVRSRGTGNGWKAFMELRVIKHTLVQKIPKVSN